MVIISDWYVIGSTQISWKAFHLPITSTKVQNTTTVAIEKRRAYPTAIEKPRQPLDNRPCVLPGLLCSWKMCYACSNCELYSSA